MEARDNHLSELFRIVEGAVRLDGEKVRNYAQLLASKLQEEGDVSSADRLRQLLNDATHQLHPRRLQQQPPPPVDGESRFPLLQHTPITTQVSKYVFSHGQREFIEDYISVARCKATLEKKGIAAGTNLLLYGPPGCGKTLLACYVAKQIGLPLYTARLDGLISSFLGSTAKNIRAVFEFAARTPCVLLLDEFDAIAKLRDDQQELGELKRVVNSFVQNIDALGRDTILIAATNHEQLLDPAIWRRFEYVLHLDFPSDQQRFELWSAFSDGLSWTSKELHALADLSEGFPCSSIESVSTRLKQRLITNDEKPTLRGALLALAQLPQTKSGATATLTQSVLNDIARLEDFLRSRDQKLYSLSMIAQIGGLSKATLSRRAKNQSRKG
jgi:ATPase family protein associated with various cellular activities (AAA)